MYIEDLNFLGGEQGAKRTGILDKWLEDLQNLPSNVRNKRK